MENAKEKYADIIGLPHHKAANRKPMSLYDRAAQFAPFAALVGYDEMITEEARLTDAETPLSEGDIEVLNRKLSLILDMVEEKQHPEIIVLYFEPGYRKDGGSWRRIGELPYEPKLYGEEENRYVWYDRDVEPGKTYTYTVRTVNTADGSFVSWYDTDGWSQKYSAGYYAPKLQYAIFGGVDKILVQAEENKFGISSYLLEIWNNGNSGTTNITSEPVYLRFGDIEEGKTYVVYLTGLDDSGNKATARGDRTEITMVTAPENMSVEKTGDRKYRFRWWGGGYGSYGAITLISDDGELTLESEPVTTKRYEFDLSDYPEDVNWNCIVYNCTKDGISCSMPYSVQFRESDYN